jgi:phage shock protein PspC (stress-responsive transcriptional regulator)/predicted membrane protein
MVEGEGRPHHGGMNDSPPRPPGTGSGRRLVREPEDRMVGGVCSGVADALGLDVTLVRVATVVLTLITPWTIVAYLVALFLVPERGADEPRVRSEAAGPLAHAHPAVVVAAVVVAVALLGDAWWLHPIPAALALVGLGVWLVTRDRATGSHQFTAHGAHSTTIPADVVDPPLSDVTAEYEGNGPPGEPSPPGSAWSPGAPPVDEPIEPVDDLTEPVYDLTEPLDEWYTVPTTPPATSPAPAAPPPSPALAPIVTAILLVGGGLLWLLDSLGAVDVGWRGAMAIGLVLVGVTLIVATWWGRASGLVGVAVLLALLLVTDDAVAVPLNAGIGDRTVLVTTSEEAQDHQQLLIGDLTVDLTGLPAQSGSTQDVDVSVGIGQVQVIVPRDAAVTAEATLRAGDLDWPGPSASSHESGADVDRTFSLPGEPGAPRLHLDLTMGFGDVEVVRG